MALGTWADDTSAGAAYAASAGAVGDQVGIGVESGLANPSLGRAAIESLPPASQAAFGVDQPADALLAAAEDGADDKPLDLNKVKLDLLYRVIESRPPHEEVKMGLFDCVRIALEKNQDILVISFEPLKSDGDILSAEGEFDPALSVAYMYARYGTDPRETSSGGSSTDSYSSNFSSINQSSVTRSSPNFSGLNMRNVNTGVTSLASGSISGLLPAGSGPGMQYVGMMADDWWASVVGPGPTAEEIKTYYKTYKVQLGGKLQTGLKYGLQFELRDQASVVDLTDGLYNDTLVALARTMSWAQDPLHDVHGFVDLLRSKEVSGGLTLSLSQPILRGRGKVNLTRIRLANLSRHATEAQAEQQVMIVIADVMKAYWDLVGAVQNVRVRREALTNAERLLDISQRRLDIGTGAAIEVLQAKAGVATRQSELIAALSQVEDAGDRLKKLMGMSDEERFSPITVVPTDRPNLKDVELNEKASTNRALDNRPEIRLAQLQIDGARLQQSQAANDMLPQVDVQGALFRGGRGEKPSRVWHGVREGDENSYSIGMQGQVPLGNRVARGAYQKAAVSTRQTTQRLAKAKEEVMLMVRLALRNAETSRVLVESMGQTRILQETNVAAEEKRLQFGVTTSYNVLQQQQDLTAAQVQEAQALTNFEKALVEVQLAEGTLLTNAGIQFEPPEPESPVRFLRSIAPPEPPAGPTAESKDKPKANPSPQRAESRN